MADAIQSEEKRDEQGRFIVPPISPGRPKGSRNKLGEAFLAELHDDFVAHGKLAIQKTREEKPDQYLKVIAATLPKELNLKVSEIDDLSDEQIARQLASLTSRLAAAGFDIGQGAGAEAAPKPAGEVPTIQ